MTHEEHNRTLYILEKCIALLGRKRLTDSEKDYAVHLLREATQLVRPTQSDL